ncbi:fatty acyl-CoA reductase 1 [Cannabis sativa]|uniref:fatty acyl-CoA reductase 1 n=1 Tax=Cannabis sativa TaxID=3483 RepID=UPI0029CA4806|nr:fatty acyl-CoA reductase 1 [Cannabis sativa]
MEFGGLIEYLENKTILITGGAGFVAKIFVEKILRSQPNVKKIYVLLRASDSNSARHRFKTQVMEKELFRLLRAKWEKKFDSFIWERVEVVCGDISDENYLLGIKNSNLRDQMFKDVDFIVNCAATTDFFERYDVALATNTIGILNLLSFAKKCIKLKKLLHLSTAYVSGERDGIVPEKAFEFGETLKKTFTKLDFEIEHELATHKLSQLRENEASEATINATMREFGIESIIRANHFGWPNTYVFTKAMGEMCLEQFKEDVYTVILRPTMILSTYKEPFPGWIEGLRTIDIIIASIGKGKMSFFLGKPTLIVDLIPADMVVNAMILGMVFGENGMIYHVGSSIKNPIYVSQAYDYVYNYFTENPLFDHKEEKPIIVTKVKLFQHIFTLNIYMAIRFLLPLKILQMVANIPFLRCYKDVYAKNMKKLQTVMRFIQKFKHFALFNGIFEDTNSERLREELIKGSGNLEIMEAFNFDPNSIDWEDYIINTHIPGLIKYVII